MRTADMTHIHIVLSKTETARVTKMAKGRGWSVSAVVRQALWRFDQLEQQEHAMAELLFQEVKERTQGAIESVDRTRASCEASNARMAALGTRERRGSKASKLARS